MVSLFSKGKIRIVTPGCRAAIALRSALIDCGRGLFIECTIVGKKREVRFVKTRDA